MKSTYIHSSHRCHWWSEAAGSPGKGRVWHHGDGWRRREPGQLLRHLQLLLEWASSGRQWPCGRSTSPLPCCAADASAVGPAWCSCCAVLFCVCRAVLRRRLSCQTLPLPFCPAFSFHRARACACVCARKKRLVRAFVASANGAVWCQPRVSRTIDT